MDARALLQSALDGLTLGSIYALFALGLALVFGIMHLVNFAHGELIMIGGYALVTLAWLPWPVMILGAAAVVVAAALLMERIAFRPVRRSPPTTLLVTSFTLGVLLQNLAILVMGGVPRTISLFPELSRSVSLLGLQVSRLALVTIVVTVLLLVAMTVFLSRTSLGVQMRAAAEDFRMARILGVRADGIIAVAFALSGILAAVASVLLLAQTGVVSPGMGAGPVLAAFVAIVVGGVGSIKGAVVGGFVVGFASVAFQTFLPVDLRVYRDAFVYGGVVAVLLARPQGLFAGRTGSRI